ncbi:PREDICTED: uncharacterized protein LOC105449242 isoform X2 [Wasmannia auropunctata]|uniref:uncharacterized protein LOC105449242 isoform X2 n=1 Tax=Wasmannia auropunctata TaxID=64793 RepID=UPI0005EDAC54|nr:PREDICTED: uncharacterized protein LOC105449242 isoform X2 [Wasmannia auropunctata]XP_011686633.1 PREDICTED: uncharacterized protein LOC105449242 isoform X2 [Wasmannia auropunctata]
MDPENVGKETLLKVTDWLRGIWEMRRRAGGPVQQWIDSIPPSARSDIVIASECRERSHGQKPLTPTEPKEIPFSKDLQPPSMTVSAPINVPNSPAMNTPVLPSSLPHQRLASRDASFQSDSSHCSSVESLLELRKADPAAILLDLGFGGSSSSPQENGTISRIPRRFLQPSSLRGIDVDEFLKQQQETTESFDSVSLGYRGLTGSPFIAPSEIVQKIKERLREHESHEVDASLYLCDQYNLLPQNGKLSVLSPDNRQFLEQPRSKSPDMRNKRMIIGQKSFAFGRDGNLIEISTDDTELITRDTVNDHNSSSDAGESVELKQPSPENSVTFDHRYLSKYDKKLAKQLSFDDDAGEFSETDQFSKDDREIPRSLNVAQSGTNVDDRERERNELGETIGELSDARRASDGSCDAKSLTSKPFYGRRFSDGAMRIAERQSEGYALMQKRRSLKRQSRVCDTTAMHYCDQSPTRSSIPSIVIIEPNVDNEVSSDVTDSSQLNVPKPFESTDDKDNRELRADTESSFGKSSCMPPPSNVSESVDRLEGFDTAQEDSASSDHSCTDDYQACCYKGKVCKDCKHGKNCPDCCCHASKRKYRKKMEKIMQENKRLEDMLARSRREVAEIRDMLSNVLSVRMEPGF